MSNSNNDPLEGLIEHFRRRPRRDRSAFMQQLDGAFERGIATARVEQQAENVISLGQFMAAKRARDLVAVPWFNEDVEELYLSTGADDQVILEREYDPVEGIDIPEEIGPVKLSLRPKYGGSAPPQLHVKWSMDFAPEGGFGLEVIGLFEGQPTPARFIPLGSAARGEVFLEHEDLGFDPQQLLMFSLRTLS